jgi:hypothetical protein
MNPELREFLSDPNKIGMALLPVYMSLERKPSKSFEEEQILKIWEPLLEGGDEPWTYETAILKLRQSARIIINYLKEELLAVHGENSMLIAAEEVAAYLPVKLPPEFILGTLFTEKVNKVIFDFYTSREKIDELCGEEFKDVADFVCEFFTNLNRVRDGKPAFAVATEGEDCEDMRQLFGSIVGGIFLKNEPRNSIVVNEVV